MRLKDYERKEKGKRVWLGQGELAQLIEAADGTKQRFAFRLAGRCGLRVGEIVQVTAEDFVAGPTGEHLRVWDNYTKKDYHREPPVPDRVAEAAEILGEQTDDGKPILTVDESTVYRWVQRAAERVGADSEDSIGWSYVGPHDLRRTWGTHLLEQGVLPSVVMDWGGWKDWDTFRRHYLGEFSPEAIKRERRKVEYLDGTAETAETPVATISPGPQGHPNASNPG